MKAVFFSSPEEFRQWLRAHHADRRELLVGFHKAHTGKPTMTWPESVKEALCYGWIDGVRRSVDGDRYTIRFSPRRPRSVWSAVNVRLAEELIAAGRMQPAGLEAFAGRDRQKSGIYAYEQRKVGLGEHEKTFRAHPKAWKFFCALPPSYRTPATWWVVSAKQAATRERRLQKLIAACEEERRLF
jgi:uncharacterized protein YdeI (YjbR/CyaY-like superfamily)